MKRKMLVFFIAMQFIVGLFFVSTPLMAQNISNQGNNGNDIGWYTSLAMDQEDRPHISYYDYGNGDLKYCYWKVSSWDIQVIDSIDNVGRYTSITLDSNNHPHISYYDFTNGNLKYAYYNGNSWEITTIDEEGKVGLFTCIDLDKNDWPHISYVDYDNHFLKYAYLNNNKWFIEIVDENVGLGEYLSDTTSIQIDDSGLPHISYCDRENFDLKYAYFDGSSWVKKTVDDAGNAGQYSSIVLDSNGKPHISYASWSDFSLKYAYLSEDNWNVETIDDEGDVRKWTSIALDSNDIPHISYYDYTLGSLQYIFSTGDKWQVKSVDQEGSTGLFNSIFLTSDDKAVISYYDWGNKALKYASSEGDNWEVEIIEKDPFVDSVDQQQIYCSGYSYPINEGEPVSQSFSPTTSTLSRVELMLVKRNNPGGFSVSIREDLDGQDLTSISLSVEEIHEDLSWKTFDIPDINVSPGQTYYIVCSSENTEGYDMYYWYFGHNDPYSSGEAWIYDNSWEILKTPGFPDLDFGFKTFGFINEKPNKPTIDGTQSGKVNTEYSYEISATDPDNDDLWYEIEWSLSEKETIGPFPSGEIVIVNHTWSEKGDYTIRVKAIDVYNAESEWSTLQISMPKNKNKNCNFYAIQFFRNLQHKLLLIKNIVKTILER